MARTLTEVGWTHVDAEDVASMRLGAAWWRGLEARAEYPDDDPESFDALADACDIVADSVEAALAAGDLDAADDAANQWPSEAGSWS